MVSTVCSQKVCLLEHILRRPEARSSQEMARTRKLVLTCRQREGSDCGRCPGGEVMPFANLLPNILDAGSGATRRAVLVSMACYSVQSAFATPRWQSPLAFSKVVAPGTLVAFWHSKQASCLQPFCSHARGCQRSHVSLMEFAVPGDCGCARQVSPCVEILRPSSC